jgi:hypothetical protein
MSETLSIFGANDDKILRKGEMTDGAEHVGLKFKRGAWMILDDNKKIDVAFGGFLVSGQRAEQADALRMKIIPKNIRHFLGDLEGRSSGHLLILAAKWSEARGLANRNQETMAQKKGCRHADRVGLVQCYHPTAVVT